MAPPQWEPSKQGYESMFATNNLAHFLVSELLLPKIEETAKTATEARIVILSSAACTMCTSIDLSMCPVPKEEYHELGTYAVTKAIDAFHARYLQEKYRGANIYACAVHPGVIETGLLAKNEGMGTLSSTPPPPTSRSPSRPSARASRRGPRRPCSARSARTSPSTRATDTSSTSTEARRGFWASPPPAGRTTSCTRARSASSS
mmetsp:Transcript_36502/g.119270  ORF Transcript_36502/g.119270 Transcript_36502/m.119270 type:complete len:204 (-) Transcript_36502:346-957(-)